MAYRQTEYTRKKTEASRRNLLLAALKLFMTRGYHKTSMQQVVKSAGTSIGNAYFYFKNKEDLLDAVVARGASVRFSSIDALMADEPVGIGRLAINSYCMVLPPFSGGIVAKEAVRSSGDSTFMDTFMKAGMHRTCQLLRENLPDLNEDQVRFAARAWCGMGTHLLEGRILGELDGSAEDLARQTVSWQLRALGMEDDQISDGLEAIDRAHRSEAWESFLATVPHSEEELDRIVLGSQ